jgi:hypothetical protein
VPLEEGLGGGTLLRDPNHRPPSFGDELDLLDYDDALRELAFRAGINSAHDFWVNQLLDRVRISLRVEVLVVEDFRLRPELEYLLGAATGHEVILLDGKLLDALLEYSTFLALYEEGLTGRDPVAAADEIVFFHNDLLGATTGGFTYPFFEMPLDIQLHAETIFLGFLGTILYHEFGHVWFYHTADALRELGSFRVVNEPLRYEEDEADLVAGMLLRRADCDLALGVEAMDLWTFFLLQRLQRDFVYDLVLSTVYQNSLLFENLSELVIRKSRLITGYQRFDRYWF